MAKSILLLLGACALALTQAEYTGPVPTRGSEINGDSALAEARELRHKKKKGGDCVYKCPDYSKSVFRRKCPLDFEDCVCYRGYEKKNGKCEEICDYTCPDNSDPVGDCPKDVGDCECKDGYYYYRGECRPCDYECPDNAMKKPDRECYNNFDDCECKPGYFNYRGKFCKACRYTCPENSVLKPGRICPRSWRDCNCKDGYSYHRGKCTKCDYQCGPNSIPFEDRCTIDSGKRLKRIGQSRVSR